MGPDLHRVCRVGDVNNEESFHADDEVGNIAHHRYIECVTGRIEPSDLRELEDSTDQQRVSTDCPLLAANGEVIGFSLRSDPIDFRWRVCA